MLPWKKLKTHTHPQSIWSWNRKERYYCRKKWLPYSQKCRTMWAFSKDYKKNSSNRHSLHNPILLVLRKELCFFSGPPIFIIKKDKKALARWPKVSPKNNKQKYKNWKVRKETKKWAPNIRAKTITVSTPSLNLRAF